MIAFNLARAAGVAASTAHARARWATLRTQLIAVPGRVASSARRLTLHLPRDWPWEQAWQALFDTACTTAFTTAFTSGCTTGTGPPASAAS